MRQPERALQTAIYVEQRAQRKQIRGCAGDYARTVLEKGTRIELGTTDRTAGAQTAPKHETSDGVASADEPARRTTGKIKALSLIERQQFTAEYIAQGGKGNTYQPEIGAFKNALESTAYTSWLRGKIAASLD